MQIIVLKEKRKMKVSRSKLLVTTGILLILASISLKIYNLYDDYKSHGNSEIVLQKIEENISNDNNESVITIDGRKYCGILEIPKIELELPVAFEYSSEQLKYSLCMYSGNLEEGSMVICGHNNSSFLGKLDELYEGENLYFIDLVGQRHEYVISETEYVDGYDVESLIDESKNWDLIVFTCNYTGTMRYVVKCTSKINH